MNDVNDKKDKVKTLAVFSQRLAGYLMLRGFVLADMRPDREGTGKNIFFFKDTEKIRQVMTEFHDFKLQESR